MKELVAMWLARIFFVAASMAVGWYWRGVHERKMENERMKEVKK